MRIAYIIIALLVACGIGVSFYLVPTKEEVAMMKVDGSGLIESQASYETQITVGNLSAEVVFPLVRIYLQNNELERAITLLEAYLEKNPDDIRALDRIATLYQYAGRQEDYAGVLERLNQLKDDPANLEKLSDIYNYRQEYEKQVEVLEKIIENQPDKTENYIRLGYVYRQMERYADAVAIIKRLFQLHPEAVNDEAMEIWAGSLVMQGRPDDAFALVVDWLSEHSGREQRLSVAKFANVFYVGSRPDLSLKLLEPHEAAAAGEPELTAAFVRAELATGQEKKAFDRMMGLYQNKALPDSLRELFLEVAIKSRNIEMVGMLVAGPEAQKLSEQRLLQIVDFYQQEQKFDQIEKLRTDIGAEKMAKLQVVDAVMALALGEADAKAKMETLVLQNNLAVYQAMALSQACANADFMELSRAFLESLSPYLQVKDPDLAALAGLFLVNDLEDEGLKLFEGFREKRPSLFVDIGWVKLATAKGQEKEVVQWLNMRADDVINVPLLKDIYYIANDYGHHGIAVVASKRLYWRDPSDENQFVYANALVQNNQPVAAMEHLKELKDVGYDVGGLYLSTLYAAARQDPKYRGELLEYLEVELNQPETPKERKFAILQLMVQHGIASKYEPLARENALKGDKDWYYLYATMLKKAGKHKELKAFDREIAMRPGAPAEVKRRYAYNALADGNKEDALKLFAALAETSGPKSKDVQQLIYLWGPRPEEPQLNWLAHRAVNAPPSERDDWLEALYQAGGYEQLVAIVEKLPAEKRGDKVSERYMNALLLLGQEEKIEYEVARAVERTNDAEALEKLGDFAMANSLYTPAEAAYKKLEKLEPNNQKMLMNLGSIAFNRNDYAGAYGYFSRYNQAGGRDYRSYYYAGESLWKTTPGEGRDRVAAPFFTKALEAVKTEKQDKNARLIAAQSLFRLQRYAEAQAAMKSLVDDYPRETVLKADYALMLVTSKQYDNAKYYIQTEMNRQAPPPEAARTFAVPAAGLVDVRTTQVPNELVLVYGKPINAQPAALATLNQSGPDWIDVGTVGYESAVITTDYGYELQSDFGSQKTGNVNIALLPLKPSYSPAAEKEARMRVDLLRAQIELETGNQREARMYLEKVNEEYPNKPGVLAALSNTEYYMGHNLKALDHIEQAYQLEPSDDGVRRLRDRIIDGRRDFVKADAEVQFIDDDIQFITELSGEKRLNRENVVGVVLGQNYVSSEGIRRADGRFGDFDMWRTRQEVYGRHELENGDAVRVSLYSNLDTAGAGIEYLARYFRGDISVFADYHRPNWDFTEGVQDYAVRDRVGFLQTFRIRPDIAPYISAAYNQYSVEDHSNVDQSVTVTGVARLPLYYLDASIDRRLFAEYGLDAEYRLDEERGTDALGNSYLYYPLITREVHYATVGIRDEINTPYIMPSFWEAYAGFAWDRFGGNGPYIGGRWVQQLDADKEASIRASHSISFKDTGADATRVGGYLNWKF